MIFAILRLTLVSSTNVGVAIKSACCAGAVPFTVARNVKRRDVMTDLDKQAAARLVAERIGYKVHIDDEGFFFCQYPDGEYSDSVFPSEEEAIAEAFPLFDRTAGALAREEASLWLWKKGWQTVAEFTDERKIVHCRYQNSYRLVEGTGTTLAEARATAICNAVRGMRDEEWIKVRATP